LHPVKIIEALFKQMINRILIRIKVLQIVFAFYQTGNSDLKVAENELMLSLRRSYDLYHYLLSLIVETTRMYERLTDTWKNKFRPTEDEKNPDMRILNNRLAKLLEENEYLLKYNKDHGVSWSDDADFVKKILDMILKSDIYSDYLKDEDDSFETDKNFWKLVFKRLICGNPFVEEYLEEKSIYWNEDVDIIESFVLKTIKRFDEALGGKNELMQMFGNDDDYEYVVKLFRQTLLHGDEYRILIDKHTKNWESERLANMDIVIMQVAIAELLNFPTIPISVTLNEYIDAAKYYSTPKSGTFVNGVLDTIVEELKSENKLLKS
jgi:N utilization substance protein B